MSSKSVFAFIVIVGVCSAQAPDNSKKNERGRANATLTAENQSNDKKDFQLLRNIRRDITKSDTFSMYAKNVKIIVLDGRVTLRGPVKTEDEKSAINTIAEKYAGAGAVDNYLEIAPSKP